MKALSFFPVSHLQELKNSVFTTTDTYLNKAVTILVYKCFEDSTFKW